jgi:hypothetical protein
VDGGKDEGGAATRKAAQCSGPPVNEDAREARFGRATDLPRPRRAHVTLRDQTGLMKPVTIGAHSLSVRRATRSL